MPPSLNAISRQVPQPLTVEDQNRHGRTNHEQAVLDFQARKKLLAGNTSTTTTTSTDFTASSDTRLVVPKKKTKKRQAGQTVSSATNASGEQVLSTSVTDGQQPNALDTTSTAGLSAYGGLLGGVGAGYGMGGMGMMGSPYGGIGMMGSPYGMGMMGGMGMGGPFLSSLNQFLFGIQTAIYSLSSAVQVIGMNTHALQQLVEAASGMVDHALRTYHELRTIELNVQENESDEQKMRRRRLKALRWALLVGTTYAAYRLIRGLMVARKQRRRRLEASYPSSYYNANGQHSGYDYGGASAGGYNPYPHHLSSGNAYGMSSYSSNPGSMGGMNSGGGYGGYGGGFYQ